MISSTWLLAPGYFAGPKNTAYSESEAGQRFATRFIPTGRAGPRDALNGPLLFPSSSMSDHMTSQVLVVNGDCSFR